MATSKKGKKVVNQEELRRLMREKQRQATDKKRVESPFAKYNSLGHLSCVLCNVQVKSELLWPAHVLGKQHKEKVAELKGAKSQPAAVKRRAPDSEDVNGEKRVKPTPVAGQSAGFSGRAAASTQKSAGLSLLAGVYDDDEEVEEEGAAAEPANPANPAPPNKEAEAAGLPEDFFDSSVPSHSGSILKAEGAEKKKKAPGDSNTAEALPEGFFDDPVTDAKVRNVDAPQDQMDREWEEFQREIRQVNTKSEAIVAEDDEEGRLERQIDEIDEQIECYRRVEVLRDRRDTVKSKPLSNKGGHMEVDASDDDDEEEEEDEEELLGLLSRDWRAKGALA